MRVLVVHNYYQQPGGEDTVFSAEAALLRQRGHEVWEYVDDNHRVSQMSGLEAAAQAVWSGPSYRRLLARLRDVQPDVVHFHNTFLLISPSAYYACQEAGVPVVQSLHNPRLLCPAASFYRDGHVCVDCLGKTPPWPGVLHACYRHSRAQTGLVAAVISLHRWLGTWERRVDAYIAFTEFYRRMFAAGGLPSEKIAVKPHFVDPDPGATRQGPGDYALFVGRLERAKGVATMLRAWEGTGVPLKIRGDGPEFAEQVGHLASQRPGVVQQVGRLSREDLNALIKGARFLLWPSEGYSETFGLVAVEAFACGVPVIASRVETASAIVEDGRTGLLFAAGDPEDLAAKVEWAWDHPGRMSEMGWAAREEYEAKYTAERNYRTLMEIYETAIERRGKR